MTELEQIIKTTKKTVYRKATLSDFFTDTDTNLSSLDKKNLNQHKFKKSSSIHSYRIQGEFGEKKYIKP